VYTYRRCVTLFRPEECPVPLEYLSRPVFLAVREQLAAGVKIAQIAADTGLATATIEGIEAGRVGPSRIVVDDDHPLRDEMLSATRCAGCGALVFAWPCLACQMAAGGPLAGDRVSGLAAKAKRRRVRARARRRKRAA
jgi:hypothetical protein